MAKTIFITGASTGLGRATALLFAGKGWNVIASMRAPQNETELDKIPGVTVLTLDVTDPGQIATAARKTHQDLGPIDVLFNNAGYGLAGAFEGATDTQLVNLIDTNLLGVMRVTQAFLPAMRERGEGAIVTTTSIGGLVTFPFNAVYHATKWGLEAWSESLAYELSPLGLRVKTVAPGGMATDFHGRSVVFTPHSAYMGPLSSTLAAFTERRPHRSTADQIAEVVWEAATDDSDRITFVAGDDAKATYAQRLAEGVDAFRANIRKMFLDSCR